MRCEELGSLANHRLVSPSAERNRAPISEVLSQVLPERGVVLEIGSGTGQHVVHFARAMPNLIWQPSERDDDCLRSIVAWLSVEQLPNVRPPLHLDVSASPWHITSAAALVCINMIHIAPWSATQALFCGGEGLLSGGGVVCLYGPFRRQGRHTSKKPLTCCCAGRTRTGAFVISMRSPASRTGPGSICFRRTRCRPTT